MIPLLLSAALLAPVDESHYVDASLPVSGQLLEARFIDLDLDGRTELVLALRTDEGRRELRIHAFDGRSVSTTAKRTIRVLDDVVAWTFADVREDPGRELVMLTRGGAFAMDPDVERMRGNIARLIDSPLLFDVPDPHGLPYWAYVLPAKKGERLLLPDRDGFSIYGPSGAEGAWSAETSWPAVSGSNVIDPDDDERRQRELEADQRESEVRFSMTVGEALEPFLSAASGSTLAADGRSMRAPALLDVNGDGILDLLLETNADLRVHIGSAAGIPAQPTRVEKLPDFLKHGGRGASLRLVDLDGDRYLDVLAVWSEELESFENVEWRVFPLRATASRMLPDKPSEVLRFQAASLRIDVAKIDDDSRPDLMVRSFVLPGRIQAATGLEFEHSYLLYRGEKRRFASKPTMRQVKTYDEEGVRDVLANRRISHDCSGDGFADLVEVALDGGISIKRLRKESGFFSGTTWEIDDAPWKSYGARGSVTSLEVEDLNGDGLGDIVSRAENGLTLLLSRKGRR